VDNESQTSKVFNSSPDVPGHDLFLTQFLADTRQKMSKRRTQQGQFVEGTRNGVYSMSVSL
jgi:hypothetical protein